MTGSVSLTGMATILSIKHYESSDPDLVALPDSHTGGEVCSNFLSDFCVAYSAVGHLMK